METVSKKPNFTNKVTKIFFIVAVSLLSLLSLASAFSPFSLSQSSVLSCTIALVIPLAIFLIGYYLRQRKAIDLKDLLLIIGAGFAVITLVNTIATWANYGLLHLLIWNKTPIYYYAGTPYDITKEAMGLYNMKLEIVFPEYFGLFATICTAYLPVAFLADRKKDLLRFIVCLSIGCVGIVSIISIGLYKALVVAVVTTIVSVLYKFLWKNKKAFNIFKYIIWGLIGLAVVFYILAAINALSGFPFSGFFGKVFETNAIMSKVSDVLGGIFIKDGVNGLINFFGLSAKYAQGYQQFDVAFIKTGIIEVEIIKEAGVLGSTLFLLFLGISIKQLDRDLSYSDEDEFTKFILFSFLFTFFFYASLFYDASPTIHEISYTPIMRSPITYVVLLIVGALFGFKKEEVKQ